MLSVVSDLYVQLTSLVSLGANFSLFGVNYASSPDRMCRLLLIIKHVAGNLKSGKITTVRDLYYQDVALFQRQSAADSLVALLTTSLNTHSCCLNIYPSQKTLVFGQMFASQTPQPDPYLIPDQFVPQLLGVSPSTLEPNSRLEAVVVFEKDAVFKSFVEFFRHECPRSVDKVLLLTGKGFPDHTTRHLLNYLDQRLAVPIVGFVDSDVYGLSILQTYKFYRNHTNSITLEGVFIHEHTSGFLAINQREFSLMVRFLNRVHYHADAELRKWTRETQRGLVLFKKAEMNSVGPCHTYFLSKIQLRLLDKLT